MLVVCDLFSSAETAAITRFSNLQCANTNCLLDKDRREKYPKCFPIAICGS